MDLLEKQLSKLNGEIDGITSDIRDLYLRLDSEQDTSLREDFKQRITKLETEKRDLMVERKELPDKLQPGGMPSKVRKNGMLISMKDKLFYYRGQEIVCGMPFKGLSTRHLLAPPLVSALVCQYHLAIF